MDKDQIAELKALHKKLKTDLTKSKKALAIEEAEEQIAELESKIAELSKSIDENEHDLELAKDENSWEVFKSVAIEKSITQPGEFGILLTKESAEGFGLPDEAEEITKGYSRRGAVNSIEDLYPTDEQLKKINEIAMIKRKRENTIVLTLSPAGKKRDSQFDEFEDGGLGDMKEKGWNTPLIIDHDRSLHKALPVATVFESDVRNGRLYENAYADLDQNPDVLKAIMNGSINKLSVGILVHPLKRRCTSCKKSIYDKSCPHQPGSVDEKGNVVGMKITGVEKYLERSLVNCAAQDGTSIKSFGDSENSTADRIINDVETIKGSTEMTEEEKLAAEQAEAEAVAKAEAEKAAEDAKKSADEAEAEAVAKAAEEAATKVDAPAEVKTFEVKVDDSELKKSVEALDGKLEQMEKAATSITEMANKSEEALKAFSTVIEAVTLLTKEVLELKTLQAQLAEDVHAAMSIAKEDVVDRLAQFTAKQQEVTKSVSGSEWVTSLGIGAPVGGQ
jgi:hypothetical protein